MKSTSILAEKVIQNTNFTGWAKRIAWWLVMVSLLLNGCAKEQHKTRKLFSLSEARSLWTAVAFSPNNKMLAVITEDDQVQLRNVSNSRLLQILTFSNNNPPATVAFSSDSKQLGVSTKTEVQIWDIEKAQLLKTLSVADLYDGRGTIAFSPDNSLLAMNGGGVLRIWNIQNGEIVTNEDLSRFVGGFSGSIIFSPKGDLLAFYAAFLNVWNVENEELVASIPERPDSFAFTADSTELVSTRGNKVFRWRMSGGELIDNFTVEDFSTLTVLPPDANTVVGVTIESISSETTEDQNGPYLFYISFWNVEDGEMLWQMPIEDIELLDIISLVASPTGDRIAMIGFNNGIHIWQIR